MAARPAAAAAEPDRHTCPPSRCAGHNLPDVDAMPLPNSSTTHAAITYGDSSARFVHNPDNDTITIRTAPTRAGPARQPQPWRPFTPP